MPSSPILTHLNRFQQAAVTYNQGPLMILAGAGSGKTRVLTHRAAWLIQEKGISPENILLLTFTNKAAEEMRGRLKKLLVISNQLSVVSPFAGTFHSFCARVLRQDGKYIGIPPSFTIYDSNDQLATVRLALNKLDVSPKLYKPTSVLTTISQAKNELLTPLEYAQYVRGNWQETVARLYAKYQKLLKDYDALDFDDLLNYTVKLFQNEKPLLEKYQNKFPWILIDEYQDTNHAQYALTKLLAKKSRNLTVVGDASQAIYGWRGADYRNLLNLQQDFSELKIINLEQNYRSTQIILEAANQVINKNTSHPVLNLWTDRKGGEKITLYQAKSEIDEAFFVINQITGQSNFSHFAVLYRTNAQSRVIEEAFIKTGIPYNLVGGVGFYERREIKDLIAYLRLIANPKDVVSLKRAEKVGKTRFKKFQEFARKIKEKLSSEELLDEIIEKTDYLGLYDENDPQDFARIENVKELRSVAIEFPDLNQFLENVSLIQQEYLPSRQPKANGRRRSAVTLMTVHAAKGTEFPIVFLVGMEEGLFPHSRAMMEKSEMEEERRLCYVALTRAKQKIYISFSSRRFYFGERSENPVSRFIADIPTQLLELKGATMDLDF